MSTPMVEGAETGIAQREYFSHEQLRPLYQKAGIPDGWNTTYAVLVDKMKAMAGMPLLHEPGEK